MKEVKMAKWEKGLSMFVSKRDLSDHVEHVKNHGKIDVKLRGFITYSMKNKSGGWKNAVNEIFGRNGNKVIDTISNKGFIEVTKSRLSKLG
jgi:hypothetical protein